MSKSNQRLPLQPAALIVGEQCNESAQLVVTELSVRLAMVRNALAATKGLLDEERAKTELLLQNRAAGQDQK